MGRVETVHDARHELDPRHYQHLEAGGILLFPDLGLGLSEADRRFLLRQRQSEALYHKNIAYRPAEDILTGTARGTDQQELRRILRAYSQQAARTLERLLPRYAAKSRLDFASYRPFEEQGRALGLRLRNDLMHVDAFPTRPTHGDRILRFFTNPNPVQPRVWLMGESFEVLAEALAREARLEEEAQRRSSPLRRTVAGLGRWTGIRSLTGSPYDALMHRFHHFMKENQRFQKTCLKERVEFPPGSSWLVFTDAVSHAVLSGQFALEQTFIVSRRAMLAPEHSPLSVLERLTGMPLTWPGCCTGRGGPWECSPTKNGRASPSSPDK